MAGDPDPFDMLKPIKPKSAVPKPRGAANGHDGGAETLEEFASSGGATSTEEETEAKKTEELLERINEIGSSDRWRPASLDLQIALDNPTKNQTYNTPALATLVMLDAQLNWMLANGSLAGMAARSAASSSILYSWAEARDWATPFVTDPAHRSNVVGTIDIDD